MKLEVGEFYLSASGEILELESFLRDGLFIDTNGQKYDIDGVAVDMLTNYDLIAHIPKQLHFRLCEIAYSKILSLKLSFSFFIFRFELPIIST